MCERELLDTAAEPTRGGALLDLLFANREGLVGDVVVKGCLWYNNHKMIEFWVLGEVRTRVIRTAMLDFQRANFGLFRRLVDGVP